MGRQVPRKVSVPSRGYFFPIRRSCSDKFQEWGFPSPLGVIFFRSLQLPAKGLFFLRFRPLSGLFFPDAIGWWIIAENVKRVSVPSRGYFFPIYYRVIRVKKARASFRPLSGLFFSDKVVVTDDKSVPLFPSPLGVIFFRCDVDTMKQINAEYGFRPLSGLFFSDWV